MEISACTRTDGMAELQGCREGAEDSLVAQEAPGGHNCWAGTRGGVPLSVLHVYVGPES